MANKKPRKHLTKSPPRDEGKPTRPVTGSAAGWAAGAWPFGVLALLALIFHGRLVFAPPGSDIVAHDIAYYFQWLHLYCGEQFRSWQVPLWNPYNYAGMPFAANPQAMVFYPPVWLCALLNVGDFHRLLVVVHGMMSGVFMYMFLRRLGPGKVPSLLGAIPYMLGTYSMANVAVGHLTMLFTMAWLPLVMYCLERSFSGPRWYWLFWTSMTLGVQALAGEPQSSLYTAMSVAGYGLIRTLLANPAEKPVRRLRRLGWWAIGLIFVGTMAAAAGAVQLLPTAEFAALSDRSAQSFEFATTASLAPAGFFEFLLPWSEAPLKYLNMFDLQLSVPRTHEFAGYVGLITLALAGASFLMRGHSSLWAARIMAIVALVLMLGRHTPLYQWIGQAFPPLMWFRIPSRAGLILQWCMSVMAAFAAAGLFESQEEMWRSRAWRWPAIACGVAGIAILIAAVTVAPAFKTVEIAGQVSRQEHPLLLSDPIILRALVMLTVTTVALLLLGWMNRTAAIATIAIVLTVDLWTARPSFHILRYDDWRQSHLDQMTEWREAAGPSELFRVDVPPLVLDSNAALYGRVENVNAYTPMVLQRLFRFVHWMRGVEPSPRRRHQFSDEMYHVQSAFPLRILNVLFGAVWDRNRGQFEDQRQPQPLARAWLVDVVEVIADDQAALNRLSDPWFNPARAVILAAEPSRSIASSTGALGVVQSKRVSSRALQFQVDARRDCWLVISEMHYPGWTARDNGVLVPLERADYLINAIPLSAGKHTVDYRYDPLSVKIGAAMTGLMVIASAVVFLQHWRGRVDHRPSSEAGSP